jgi:uncharacterized damage-inducible protein DinB
MAGTQTLGSLLALELEHEGAITRKLIAAVPEDRFDHRPHDKSWTARQLVGHLTEIPGWVPAMLEHPQWDMAHDEYILQTFESVQESLEFFDRNLGLALKSLRLINDHDIQQPWTMRCGERIYIQLPRSIVVRNFILNHSIHHRAQLGVYLRLMDVPVPAVYGSSADDLGIMGS